MTHDEKEALLGYLEFTLTNMVQELEQQQIVHGPAAVGATYDAAYEVLNEMERTLNDYYEVPNEQCTKQPKS